MAAVGAGPLRAIYRVPMRRGLLCAVLALAGVLAAVPAHASGPAPGDETNPFVCTLQQLGGGTDFPQPEADPFCVEHGKTHQNVDKLGVVDFLSKEPARVAAASPKCFYFQRDHWTGFVSESAPQTQTYHWDGSTSSTSRAARAARTWRTSPSAARAATRRSCPASRPT